MRERPTRPGPGSPPGPPRVASPGAVPPFTIAVSRDGDRLSLRVRGELDIATVPELERTLALALGSLADAASTGAPRPSRVELDLRRVDFIDLQGVRAVCRCADRVDAHRGGLVLTLGPQARRTLALCGVLERFEPASAPD